MFGETDPKKFLPEDPCSLYRESLCGVHIYRKYVQLPHNHLLLQALTTLNP